MNINEGNEQEIMEKICESIYDTIYNHLDDFRRPEISKCYINKAKLGSKLYNDIMDIMIFGNTRD